jgi:hypothetical protein
MIPCRNYGERARRTVGRVANSTHIAASCLLLFALHGCARYEETIVLDQNGAGTAAILLSWPASGPQADEAALLAGTFGARFGEDVMTNDLPAGVVCEYQKSESDGRVEIRATYRFDNVNTLLSWATKAGSPFNSVSVVRTDGSLEYTRAFGRLRPEEMAVVRATMADARLTFRFTGPGALLETSAAKREGNTAVWEFRAPELFEGRTMTARYGTGIPSWVWHLVAGGALGAAGAVFYLRRKRQAR